MGMEKYTMQLHRMRWGWWERRLLIALSCADTLPVDDGKTVTVMLNTRPLAAALPVLPAV